MSKWIAEFELEDGDTMPEHMDLEYKGVRIDFHCKPQEPTTKNNLGVDAISREKAIAWAEYYTDAYDAETANELIAEMLKELPSATPQEPKWIPVTEDVPPKGTICLWCNKQGSVFASEITYRSKDFSYVGKHGYFSNGLENYGDIVAWMPLPKAYKAESEG